MALESVQLDGLPKELALVLNRYGIRFRIVKKSSSRLMKIIGLFFRLVGQNFNEYVTTLGRTIYWNRDRASGWSDAAVLYHESIHVYDYDQHPFWFVVSYLFPQILIPLFWVGAVLGGVLWCWWVGLIFAALPAVVLFLPAPWRTRWEIRGYAGQYRFLTFYGVKVTDIDYYRVARRQFASSAYLWMCPRATWVAERLRAAVEGAEKLPGWGVAKIEILRDKASIPS